jgi:hypothetical protein
MHSDVKIQGLAEDRQGEDLVDRLARLTDEGTPDALDKASRLLSELANMYAPPDLSEQIIAAVEDLYPRLDEKLRLEMVRALAALPRCPELLCQMLLPVALEAKSENLFTAAIKKETVAILQRNAGPEIRAVLFESFLQGDTSLVSVFQGTSIPEELAKLNEGRKSQDSDVAKRCLEALKFTPDRAIADEVLAEFLGGSKEKRGELALVLGGKAESRYVDALVLELRKGDLMEVLMGNPFLGLPEWIYRRIRYGSSTCQYSCAQALAGSENSDAVRELSRRLRSGDEMMPKICAEGLRGSKDPVVQDRLVALVAAKEKGMWIRWNAEAAAQSLQGTATSATTAKLVALAKAANLSSETSQIIAALNGNREPAVQELMKSWLLDKTVHKDNRILCARSLYGSVALEISDEMLEALADEDPDIALAVSRGLEALRTEKVQASHLAQLENGQDLRVSVAFAGFLAKQGALPKIQEQLIEGLRSGDSRRAFLCSLALKNHSNPDAIDALLMGLQRDESRIGCACAIGPRSEENIGVLMDGIHSAGDGSELARAQGAACLRALVVGIAAPGGLR